MADAKATPRKTIGSFANLPGQPLDEIAGEEVEVSRIEITTRRLRDNPDAPFAVITLSDGAEYHTWSAYLIEKFEQVPGEELPLPATFSKVKTDKGREVWTVS